MLAFLKSVSNTIMYNNSDPIIFYAFRAVKKLQLPQKSLSARTCPMTRVYFFRLRLQQFVNICITINLFLRNIWIDQRIFTNGIVFGTYALIWFVTGSTQILTFPIAYCFITSIFAPSKFTKAKIGIWAFNAFTIYTFRSRLKFPDINYLSCIV